MHKIPIDVTQYPDSFFVMRILKGGGITNMNHPFDTPNTYYCLVTLGSDTLANMTHQNENEWHVVLNRLLPYPIDTSTHTHNAHPAPGVLSIKPNPATNKVFVKWGATTPAIECRVTDMLGRLVVSPMRIQDTFAWTVDVSHLSAGSYFMSVTDALGRTSTERLIIQ
jgi:hypothetical protein